MLQPIQRHRHGNPVPDRRLWISPLCRILNSINFQLPSSRPQVLRSLSNPQKPLYPLHQIFKNGPIKPRIQYLLSDPLFIDSSRSILTSHWFSSSLCTLSSRIGLSSTIFPPIHSGSEQLPPRPGQRQLGETQTEIQQRIQERLKEMEELNQAAESLKKSTMRDIKKSNEIFTELIQSIEKIHTEVIELIGANEKAAVNQAEGRMKKLEQEIAELRRRNTELKQLSETEDHIHFLQECFGPHPVSLKTPFLHFPVVEFPVSLCPPEAGDLPSVTVNTDISFGAVKKAVSELKNNIEDFCKGRLVQITNTDSCQLTLDPYTVHGVLRLSEGNRKVTRRGETQRYPDHPERFDSWKQVLCREGLSGIRCYWEIEWSGEEAFIGVTYKGISRKGWNVLCVLGGNDKSWSLSCSDSSFTARHKNNHTAITAPHFPRIGVYLDFNAGTLSFYGVSNTMTLLHRFQTTFTEPLYPGFGLDYDSTVTICQLN
ncbi:UNVERIFIED_CONTAM: hypothetical protein FKN15_038201 [Acipenser sinensis]